MKIIEPTYHCENCGTPQTMGRILHLDLNNTLVCDECADIPNQREATAPTAEELKAIINAIIDKVYAIGLKKHGEHKWYYGETVRHHVDRTIRHCSTAMMRKDGNESVDVDGEDDKDHMERAVIRGLFALVKMKNGHE